MDLDFVPGVAFIPDVYMADSLRARTLINLSAVLYEQAAARTGLSAEVGNMDLDFVPGVAFISDVYMADSLRARTLINLSAVFLRARTLINLSAVGIMDLDFVPGVAFDAMGNVELTGDLLGDADCVNNNNNNVLVGDNMEELICVSKVKEFGRVDMKSLTGLCLLIDGAKANGLIWMAWIDIRRKQLYCKRKWAYDIGKFYKGLIPGELGSIYVLRSVDEIWADVADVFDTVVSKLDEVPTRELSSYIKIELLRDNGRKFYRLVITGEDTHCKQTIKKAYIMLLERALLILFMI
ncbi:hypothetical protein HBH78_244640 [Parastagonospora nodorum]|nr:hypothetical protein HBH78_244640 [Parastagonospora nodorum]